MTHRHCDECGVSVGVRTRWLAMLQRTSADGENSADLKRAVRDVEAVVQTPFDGVNDRVVRLP